MNRSTLVFAIISLVLAIVIVRYPNEQPGFTDAYYHYNAAVNVATGRGFTDDYLWTYIGAPDTLPAPSHLYWMPGTTMVAALGMVIFGANFAAAQLGLVLCLWGAGLLTYQLALRQQGKLRHAWAAALLVLFGGFYMRFWGTTDTFAPYLFFGALALWLTGEAAHRKSWLWWLAAGAACGAGHLVRSDGLLLLLVGLWALVLLRPISIRQRLQWSSILVVGYLLVMSLWFWRNLSEVSTILPVGGTQAIWYVSYDDLFRFPPDASPARLFGSGLGVFINSRLEGISFGLQNLLAIEGFVVLAPFMLGALWQRRRDLRWGVIGWFALAVHGAFAILFPFPGNRGGLFHAVAALMPFWAVLAVMGVDDAVVWIAKRRRNWRPATAQPIFTTMLVVLVIGVSLSSMLNRRELAATPSYYTQLQAIIPTGSRVMRNDPAQLYYYTGLGGVVLPNERPQVMMFLAEKYQIDYVLFEYPNVPELLYGQTLSDKLVRVPFEAEGVELYAVRRP